MSVIHAKATRALLAVVAVGILTAACSETTGPSQGGELSKGVPLVHSDSARAHVGF